MAIKPKPKPIKWGVESLKYKKEEIRDTRKWLKAEILKLGKPTGRTSDLRQRGEIIDIGRMCFFKYDPKHKLTLPYYDIFPLIIVIDFYQDGFLGLNLHYLPPKLRVLFLGRLLEVLNNHKLDKSTKLNVTYGLLKSASKYKYFKPCIKRYLAAHVRSNISVIRFKQWPKVILLPTAKFKKSSAAAVWKDSKSLY